MIEDRECNLIYFSDLISNQLPELHEHLIRKFEQCRIDYSILKNTKDLWVRDFMPIQVANDYFVQFTYDPDYLKPKKYQKTKSDPELVTKPMGIQPEKVSILLDGGNVVKSKTKVIITSKVFIENPGYTEILLIEGLKKQLRVEEIIVVPQEPKDWLGHADGMVRFVDENTVLINQYPINKEYLEFGYALRCSLSNAGLRIINIPYTAWQNRDLTDATGCYINFLEIGDYIFYPTYARPTDATTENVFRNAFPDRRLVNIDCRDLAKLGGVLNCVTWTIRELADRRKADPPR
jgi:agmatine deiminase